MPDGEVDGVVYLFYLFRVEVKRIRRPPEFDEIKLVISEEALAEMEKQQLVTETAAADVTVGGEQFTPDTLVIDEGFPAGDLV